jgi:hypothetical protein
MKQGRALEVSGHPSPGAGGLQRIRSLQAPLLALGRGKAEHMGHIGPFALGVGST